MAHNSITSFFSSFALSAVSLSLVCVPAFAQSSGGWQDLDSLVPPDAVQPSTERSGDGWQDLGDYETPPSEPAAARPRSDGWQDLESFPAEPAVGATTRSSDWIDIENDIAAVRPQISRPTAVLSAGDLIDISVAHADSLGGAYRISSIGTLYLPLIGSVDAAGLSPDALETKLEQLYAVDFLIDPNVTVTTREKIIGNVKLEGLINRPGPVSLMASDTLSSLLTKGGGVTGVPFSLDAIILSSSNNRVTAKRVPLRGIATGDVTDVAIFPGDQITVLQREQLPAVKNSNGSYPLLDTVLSGRSLRTY